MGSQGRLQIDNKEASDKFCQGVVWILRMFYFCGLQAIVDDKTLNFVFKSFFTFGVKMHLDRISGVSDFFLKGLWFFLCYNFLCHFFTPPFRTQKGQIQTICLYLPCRCPYSVITNRAIVLCCLRILSIFITITRNSSNTLWSGQPLYYLQNVMFHLLYPQRDHYLDSRFLHIQELLAKHQQYVS